MQPTLFQSGGYWRHVKDGNAVAFELFKRHYSYHAYKDSRRSNPRNPNRRLIVGPGQKIVLLGDDEAALFIWRKFIDRSGQLGINCAVFRNESPHKSSELILLAEQEAAKRWPQARLYTYVNGAKIKSANPGYCYKKAGWRNCGKTQGGLVILEKVNQ